MEETEKGTDRRVLRIQDEKKFYDLIEQRFKEQGFILCEDPSSVRYAHGNEEYTGISFEDDEPVYEPGGFEGTDKIFVF